MLTTKTKDRVQLCGRTTQTNHFHGLWQPPSLCDENDEQDQIQEETGLRINGSGCNQVTGAHYDDLGQDSTEATG